MPFLFKPIVKNRTRCILSVLRQRWDNYSDNSVTAELKRKDLSFGMCVTKSVMFSNTEWPMNQYFPNVFQTQYDKVVFQITDFRFVLIFFVTPL